MNTTIGNPEPIQLKSRLKSWVL